MGKMAFRGTSETHFLWTCYKLYNCYKVVEYVYSVIGQALLRISINI